jgi:hypothetical protein
MESADGAGLREGTRDWQNKQSVICVASGAICAICGHIEPAHLRNLWTIKKDVIRLCGEHKSISTAGKTAGVQGA